jgi:hypothetical protein
MSEWLRRRKPTIAPNEIVRTNRIFSYDTARKMRHVHLYFVKLFGCHIVEFSVPIDVTTFAAAILNDKPHPNVYVRLVRMPPDEKKRVSASDINARIRNSDQKCVSASWFYHVDQLAVNVTFAEDGEKIQGMIGAWHPRLGTNRLRIADLESG